MDEADTVYFRMRCTAADKAVFVRGPEFRVVDMHSPGYIELHKSAGGWRLVGVYHATADVEAILEDIAFERARQEEQEQAMRNFDVPAF